MSSYRQSSAARVATRWRRCARRPRARTRGRASSTGREGSDMGFERLNADENAPVYVISVAAQLTGLHAQTLRQYDRLGLVSPGRAAGGGRRYSIRDIAALREIQQLSSLGIGLEGVRRILELENQVLALRKRVG